MRASRPFSPILLLLLVTFSAAWPVWPRWLPELDSIVVRQNNNNADSSSNSGSESPAASTAAPTSEATSTAESESASATGTGTITRGPTTTGSSRSTATGSSGTRSGSISGSSASGNKTRTTSYDARLPAGGISMQTPAVSDGSQYYKIGEYITFGWNYTSLSATPTAINIMATCKENSQLYTIAMNQTVEETGAVTWDTGAYQATAVSDPLLTETYTLLIYDAASSVSATAQAGYLSVFNTYTFGMYSPQPYVPLSQFVCATCSGALGDMERAALKMVVGMSVLTVLSFSWFVGGTGVIW